MEQLVLVVWRDAHSALTLEDLSDEDYLCRTVGWILDETHPWLLLVSERTPDGDRAATKIPLGDVVEVIELQPAKTLSDPWDGFAIPA